jgi:hypothetical protein
MKYRKLMATFRAQQWQGDQLLEVGRTRFDATRAFLSLPLEKIQRFRENDWDSDHLSIGIPARRRHNGPFEVDTDIDGWLEANGYEEGWEGLTAADLAVLREGFGVNVK